MIGVGDAFRMTRAAPIRPDEKESIFLAVEKAVWALPQNLFANADSDEEWEETVSNEEPVREALEQAIEPVLLARRDAAAQREDSS